MLFVHRVRVKIQQIKVYCARLGLVAKIALMEISGNNLANRILPSAAVAASLPSSKEQYLVVYLDPYGLGKSELAQNDKSMLHQFKVAEENPRIIVERQNDRLVVLSSKNGIPLYGPPNIAETIDPKSGNIALGVFPICENSQGDVLFIKKTNGAFWHVPGGLVEEDDKTLWIAGIRELKEEIGVSLSEEIEGKQLFAYESITPNRHNLMVFYGTQYNGTEALTAVPDDEILERAWFKPLTFWSSFLKEIKSPSKYSLYISALCCRAFS